MCDDERLEVLRIEVAKRDSITDQQIIANEMEEEEDNWIRCDDMEMRMF